MNSKRVEIDQLIKDKRFVYKKLTKEEITYLAKGPEEVQIALTRNSLLTEEDIKLIFKTWDDLSPEEISDAAFRRLMNNPLISYYFREFLDGRLFLIRERKRELREDRVYAIFCGYVKNPKTKEILGVFGAKLTKSIITCFLVKKESIFNKQSVLEIKKKSIGSALVDTDEELKGLINEDMNCIRVHANTIYIEQGYGTCVYAAATLTLSVFNNEENPCIYSSPQLSRSDFADKWWDKIIKLGYGKRKIYKLKESVKILDKTDYDEGFISEITIDSISKQDFIDGGIIVEQS